MSRFKESSQYLTVEGLNIQVLRKDIKSLHFVVRPPHGDVRISVPYFIDDDHLHLAVLSRLKWIRKQQKVIAGLPQAPMLEYITGEAHFYFGERCHLQIIERAGKPKLTMPDSTNIVMHVQANASLLLKEKLFNEWYRAALKQRIPNIIARWEPVIRRQVAEWGVKNMKTRWGSCNIHQRRIWLSLALAKKPDVCLEYVVVHEMAHLIERYHNQRFHRLMDKFIPDWRDIKKILES